MSANKRMVMGWTLRPQPASKDRNLPETAKERVELVMERPMFELFERLRSTILEPGGTQVKPPSPERTAALDEMHVLAELSHFLDAEIVGEQRVDTEARTDLLAAAERLETEHGFRIPEKLKAEMAVGQLRMDQPGSTRLEPVGSGPTDEGHAAERVSAMPDFDGETYERALDHDRLGAQMLRVAHVMKDGKWHTLAEVAKVTEDPEASVSARIRDLRKLKFGGHSVNRERVVGGKFKYRLVLISYEAAWGEDDTTKQEAV